MTFTREERLGRLGYDLVDVPPSLLLGSGLLAAQEGPDLFGAKAVVSRFFPPAVKDSRLWGRLFSLPRLERCDRRRFGGVNVSSSKGLHNLFAAFRPEFGELLGDTLD